MTMTWCRSCKNDVHITHNDADCPAGDANLRVPDGLRRATVERPAGGER